MTVMFSCTGPIWNTWAKTNCSDVEPAICVVFGLDTEPVTSLVTPRLAPWRTKKLPSVIRKLGMPVRITM